MMDRQQVFESIVMQLPAIISFIWWVAKEQHKIYTAISSLKEDIRNQLSLVDKRLDLHIQDSHAARESISEKVTGQGKRFGAKIERLEHLLDKNLDFKRLEEKIEKLGRYEQ